MKPKITVGGRKKKVLLQDWKESNKAQQLDRCGLEGDEPIKRKLPPDRASE